MTDYEMETLCAEALGTSRATEVVPDGRGGYWCIWNPLKNDAQAMVLVKHLRLTIGYNHGWSAAFDGCQTFHYPDLNRAIVECVAQMQKHNPKHLAASFGDKHE